MFLCGQYIKIVISAQARAKKIQQKNFRLTFAGIFYKPRGYLRNFRLYPFCFPARGKGMNITNSGATPAFLQKS